MDTTNFDEALTDESQRRQLSFNEMLTPGSVKKMMAEIEAKSRDAYQVPIAHLHQLPNFNVRVHDEKYEEHIEKLKRSIMRNGYYQDKPIAGYVAEVDGQKIIYVTDGYTRLEAVRRAILCGVKIETLPVAIKPAFTSMEDLTVGLWAANEGKPLTPYEKAVVCKRLIGYGCEESAIAEHYEVSPAYVKQLLTVIGSPIEIRRLVQDGAISLDKAYYLISKLGAKDAVAHLTGAAEKAKAEGKTRIALKHLPGATYAKTVKKEAPVIADALKGVKADPAYASLAPELRSKLDELLSKLEAAEDSAGDKSGESVESNEKQAT